MIIFVTGMHRSGTSAITKGLSALSIELGENLMSASSDNEKGYFEDLEFNRINIEILETIERRWDSLSLITNNEFWKCKDFSVLYSTAMEFMISCSERGAVVGLKDPRISLFPAFWISICNELALEWRVVHVVRDPVGVSESLRKRNQFPSLKSHLLWFNHNYSVFANLPSDKLIVVSYEHIMNSPQEELLRIGKFLNIEPILSFDLIRNYCDDFIDAKLQHNRIDQCFDLENDTLFKNLACFLDGASKLEEGFGDFSSLQTEYRYFIDMHSDFILAIDQCGEVQSNLKDAIKKNKLKLDEIKLDVKILTSGINGYKSKIVDLELENLNYKSKIVDLELEVNGYNQKIIDLKKSNSWKFTAFFRYIGKFFRRI